MRAKAASSSSSFSGVPASMPVPVCHLNSPYDTCCDYGSFVVCVWLFLWLNLLWFPLCLRVMFFHWNLLKRSREDSASLAERLEMLAQFECIWAARKCSLECSPMVPGLSSAFASAFAAPAHSRHPSKLSASLLRPAHHHCPGPLHLSGPRPVIGLGPVALL